MKKIISAVSIILCLALFLSACGEGFGEYKTPEGSFPEMQKLSSSFSYKTSDGLFRLTLTWKMDEGYTATYDDNYYLNYSMDDDRLFFECEPSDTRVLTGEIKTLKPNEKTEIAFDMEADFDMEAYSGCYQFIKVFEVTDPDGNTEKRVGVFEIEIA